MAQPPVEAVKRSSFFKYASAATARTVLLNRTLRWSSPLLFNDPFDVPRELPAGLTSGEFVEEAIKTIRTLIEDPPNDTSLFDGVTRKSIEAAKHLTREQKDSAIRKMTEHYRSANFPGDALEGLRKHWREMLPNLRVLCLTENPDHVAMWLHYADGYSGAVLEFTCVPDIDSAFDRAQQVKYPERKPDIYTVEGWTKLLLLPPDRAIQNLFESATTMKAVDWHYEKEWRIVDAAVEGERGQFSDRKFDPRELAGIYLGPLISDADRHHLMVLATDFPKVKVFNVSIGMSGELGIEEIHS